MSANPYARRQLEKALRSRHHVRLLRCARFGDDCQGFVVAIGAKWVLLAAADAGGYLRGWKAVRIEQVDRVQRRRTFEEDFARSRPEWPPRPPGDVDLDTTAGALRSLQAHARFIGIEQEDRHGDLMWVGRIDEIERPRLWLHEVDHRARWHDEPKGYRLRNITAITIGSGYLDALAQMVPER